MHTFALSFVAPTVANSQLLVSAAGAQVNSTALPGTASLVTPTAACFIRAGLSGNQGPKVPVVAATAPTAIATNGTEQILLANVTYRVEHPLNTILGFAGVAAFNVNITPEP